MAVSMKRQCTARCLQRVAQRKCWLIDNYFKEYKHLKTAEPHVASNVRYISFQRNLQLKNHLSSYHFRECDDLELLQVCGVPPHSQFLIS